MTNSPQSPYFEALCGGLGLSPDRRGWVHMDCPFCGKPKKRGQVHFSFGPNGYKCFVCGASGGLEHLARVLLGEAALERGAWRPPPVASRRKPRVAHQGSSPQQRRYSILEHNPQEVLALYEGRGFDKWQEYAPLLLKSTFAAFRLGLGAFPKYASRCQHARLIVPLLAGGKVVGFRGRAIGCDCGKWLGVGGNPSRFLYNGAALFGREAGWRTGERSYIGDSPVDAKSLDKEVVFIVENPVEAMLLYQVGCVAAATLGVTIWDDAWTKALADCKVECVVIAYDYDAPGNGGGRRGRASWEAAHPGVAPPLNGPRLANRLNREGVRAYAVSFDELASGEQVDLKTDVADLFK